MLVGTMYTIRSVPGVIRPAIASYIPVSEKNLILFSMLALTPIVVLMYFSSTRSLVHCIQNTFWYRQAQDWPTEYRRRR